jgi:hypothetical protein
MSEIAQKSEAVAAYTPISTTKIPGRIKLVGAAIVATLKSSAALIPLILVVGGLGHLLMSWGAALMVDIIQPTGQGQLWTSELTKLGVGIIWFIFAKPIVDATAIYCWRQISRGGTVQAGKAWNWAIGRYGRMLKPHAAKFVTVSAGLIIVVPGVLFGLQYAFVHAISAMEEKPTGVLARSQRFTDGRRGRIAMVWLAYVPWYLFYTVVATYQVESWGWWAVAGLGAVDVLLLTIMTMVMFSMCEERISDAQAAKARREAKEAKRTDAKSDGAKDGESE